MNPKNSIVKVRNIKKIKLDVFLLSFNSRFLARVSKPGQFLHIKIKDTILRRPISIYSIKGNTVYLLIRVRGRGTKILSNYKLGAKLDIIGPLGKGFDLNPKRKNILVAGGIGVAPLVFLAEKLKETLNSKPGAKVSPKGKTLNTVILGVKTKKDLLGKKEFKKMGFKVIMVTEDGSQGIKGTVVDGLKKILTADRVSLYCCGPENMLKAVYKVIKNKPNINCQVSFEQFMGCGLGVCCGCTIETKQGFKKVCKDGPVFKADQVF